MKLSHLAYGVAGYVLGARAGRERYDQIVGLSRRVAGSQRVQAAAGLVQGQLDLAVAHARQALADRLHASGPAAPTGAAAPTGPTGTTQHNGTTGVRRA